MLAKISRVLNQPFYCWLVGVYPILYLYSENLGLVIGHEVLASLAAMIAVTTIGFLIANRVICCRYKAAFMLSLCSLVFSLSGHAYLLIFMPRSLLVWTLLVLIALAILLVKLWGRNSSEVFERATPVLNLILLALLAIPFTVIASSYVSKSLNVQHNSAFGAFTSAGDPSPKVNDSASRPDIYSIIPDGYPSDSWLLDAMNYDNSEFTKALEERGFTVVKHTQSNYGATLVSLASILNMQFFDSNPSPYTDLDYLRMSIADSAVSRQLQQLGYTFVQFLSGYLIPSPTADINRDFTPLGPIEIGVDGQTFSTVLVDGLPIDDYNILDMSHFYKRSFISLYLDTTLLRILSYELGKLIFANESTSYGLFAPARFLDTIDEVGSIAQMREATFTLVHLMKPHGPTVFDQAGQSRKANWRPSHDEYFAEFNFTNSKFLQMIDTILENSRNEPIIIFQADHGTFFGRVWTDDRRLTLFESYAAYKIPDSYSVVFPKPFTLINTFPLILNEVFGTEYEFREDLLFELTIGYNAPFEQVDVTGAFVHK